MNEQHFNQNQLVNTKMESLSFDSFDRNPLSDLVCVSPVRTIVRREEEILLIRRVRKVEETDASPACPINTWQANEQEEKKSLVG